MSVQSITLTIPGTLEHLGALGTSIRALATSAGLDDRDAFRVELALVEATTNAIRHALPGVRDPWVAVDLEIQEKQVRAIVRNPGAAMNPRALEEAEAPQIEAGDDVNDFPEGGMGLALIKDVMQEVSYARKDGINEFCMVFTP